MFTSWRSELLRGSDAGGGVERGDALSPSSPSRAAAFLVLRRGGIFQERRVGSCTTVSPAPVVSNNVGMEVQV